MCLTLPHLAHKHEEAIDDDDEDVEDDDDDDGGSGDPDAFALS